MTPAEVFVCSDHRPVQTESFCSHRPQDEESETTEEESPSQSNISFDITSALWMSEHETGGTEAVTGLNY